MQEQKRRKSMKTRRMANYSSQRARGGGCTVYVVMGWSGERYVFYHTSRDQHEAIRFDLHKGAKYVEKSEHLEELPKLLNLK